jgi:putative FmdB family regulatory protein
VPIYEYRCENSHLTEVFQRMSDPPLAACGECGAPVQKVLSSVAIHFRGSGFYATDYGRRNGGKPGEGSGEGTPSPAKEGAADKGGKSDSTTTSSSSSSTTSSSPSSE